jgi:PAS domain S-box-containing protein
MQRKLDKLSEQEFNELLLTAIDETLCALGEGAKTAIYFHIEKKYKIKKTAIPKKIESFTQALEKLFGIGSKPIELMLLQNLSSRVEVDDESFTLEDVTFLTNLEKIKKQVVDPNKKQEKPARLAKTEKKQPILDNFSVLSNLVDDPVAIINEKKNMLFMNSACQEILGTKDNQIVGKSFLQLSNFPEPSRILLAKNLKKRSAGLHIDPYEVDILDTTGKMRRFEIKAQIIDYMGQRADLVVCRDVTEKKPQNAT